MALKHSRQVKQVIQSMAGLLTGHFGRPALPITYNYQPATVNSIISTGFRNLDNALGVGGLPCGRMIELIGAGPVSSSGALTVATGVAAKVQRKQRLITLLDLTHTFDTWQAERCGLMAPQLLLTQPQTIFEALSTLERVGQHQGLVLVILGNVDDLLHHIEPERLSSLLGRLRTLIKQSRSAFLFVTLAPDNQPFSPANYPPGFPLAEVADIRLWIQDETWSYRDNMVSAYKANLTVIKNRLAIAGTGVDLRINMSR
jgi:recombination protein RecA